MSKVVQRLFSGPPQCARCASNVRTDMLFRKQLRWRSGCGQGPGDCSRRTANSSNGESPAAVRAESVMRWPTCSRWYVGGIRVGHGSRGDGKGGNKSLPPMNFTTPDTLMRPALNCFVRRQMGAERSIVITQHRPATPKALSVNKQSRFRAAAACSHQVSSELSDIYSYLTRLYMGDRSSDRNIGGSVLFFCGRPPPQKKKKFWEKWSWRGTGWALLFSFLFRPTSVTSVHNRHSELYLQYGGVVLCSVRWRHFISCIASGRVTMTTERL